MPSSLEGWKWRSAGRRPAPAEHESRVAAIAVIGPSPTFPITMTWEDDVEQFESLLHVGVDLEFILEGQFSPDEARPRFVDAEAQRFRILINNLDVVLCVSVPDDFDDGQLELAEGDGSGQPLIVEHLNGRVHRALRPLDSRDRYVEACPPRTVQAPSLEGGVGTGLTWEAFDEAWLWSIGQLTKGSSGATRLRD